MRKVLSVDVGSQLSECLIPTRQGRSHDNVLQVAQINSTRIEMVESPTFKGALKDL